MENTKGTLELVCRIIKQHTGTSHLERITEKIYVKLWLSPAYGLELLGPHGHGELLLLLPGGRPHLHHTHTHSVLTSLLLDEI